MQRGICWVTWGDKQPSLLERSLHSVQRFGYQTCLITSAPPPTDLRFDHVRHFTPSVLDCRCRAEALLAHSPFDITLHLDTDTIVCNDITYGFSMAQTHGMACVIAPACDATSWHQLTGYPVGMVQYNAGAFFYSPAARPILTDWVAINKHDLSRFSKQDQPGLAIAIYQNNFSPYVLPHTWNFRPEFGHVTGFGPLYIWHSNKPVPNGLERQQAFWRLTGAPS